ncbi:hypothetical protein HaLaN_30121, partial [Haematococcus lacustris]
MTSPGLALDNERSTHGPFSRSPLLTRVDSTAYTTVLSKQSVLAERSSATAVAVPVETMSEGNEESLTAALLMQPMAAKPVPEVERKLQRGGPGQPAGHLPGGVAEQ